MRIDKKYKPELIACPDETRFHIARPHYDVEAKKIVATDGHMLVAVPVEVEEGDAPGPVPIEALKAARKVTLGRKGTATIALNGHAITANTTYERRETGAFPPWKQVLPDHKEGDAHTITIGLNPRYLLALANALGIEGDEGVILTIKVDAKEQERYQETLDPIVVRRNSKVRDPGEIAVLMPMSNERARAAKGK